MHCLCLMVDVGNRCGYWMVVLELTTRLHDQARGLDFGIGSGAGILTVCGYVSVLKLGI
jgi:uncharacterized membrane protein YhfC